MTASIELTLYGAPTGNCRRAAIGLCEADLAFSVRHVNLREGEQTSDSHRALNPAGKVPVLVGSSSDGKSDFVLTQSNAILFYAEQRAPGRLLPLQGNQERIKALEAYFYFVTDVIAVNGAAFQLREPEHSQAANVLTERYLAAIVGAEQFLNHTQFMGSSSFSIADIAAFTIISAVSQSIPWKQLPRLADWRDRIGSRTAVQKGMNSFVTAD